MVDKDLNLSLDSNLIQTPTTAFTHQRSESDMQPDPIVDSAPRMVSSLKTIPLVSVTLMLIIIGALFWIGFKLSAQNDVSEALIATANTIAAANTVKPEILKPDLPELKEISAQLVSLQQQLDQVRTQLAETTSLLVASHHEVTEKLANAQPTQGKALTTALTPAAPTPAKRWFVNLGTFSSKKAAQNLQQQIKSLGYTAVITSLLLDGNTVYRVQIPGFTDRDAAENTAGEIMKKTNLNGLWAWKEE